MKYKVLVIYDVGDTKRRNRINKTLEHFGVRIQRSAFECYIDEYDYEKLVNKLNRLHKEDDIIKIYRFTSRVEEKEMGVFEKPPTSEFEIL